MHIYIPLGRRLWIQVSQSPLEISNQSPGYWMGMQRALLLFPLLVQGLTREASSEKLHTIYPCRWIDWRPCTLWVSARLRCLLSQYCQQGHSHKNTFSVQGCYWENFKHFMLWESLEPDGILNEVSEMKALSFRTSKGTYIWVQSTS